MRNLEASHKTAWYDSLGYTLDLATHSIRHKTAPFVPLDLCVTVVTYQRVKHPKSNKHAHIVLHKNMSNKFHG